MKYAHSSLACLFALSLSLAACSEGGKPVPAAVASRAPAQESAAAKSTAQSAQPAAGAQEASQPASSPAAKQPPAKEPAAKEPAAKQPAAKQSAAKQPATAANGEVPRAGNPEFARGGAQRYQGAQDAKMDTGQDLSKLQLDDHVHGGEEAQDGSSLLPQAVAERNRGRIELAEGYEQTHDLGPMRQGDKAGYDFHFVSKGDEPLVVTGVKPSCGCTKAEIVLENEDGSRAPYTKGEPIPVGQKFVLESEISTDGKPGGPFNAQISIYGNDIRGAFNVRLTADIEPVLTITPSQTVFFGQMTTADKQEKTIKVTSTRGEHFQLELTQQTVQEPLRVDFSALEADPEGKSNEWEIKVSLGPNCKIGMNSFPLQFKTDIPIAHPKYPSADGSPQMHGFMLNVQAQVSGMVSAEPLFLTFGMVRPGEPIERSLRIQCHDDFKLSADIPVVMEGLQGQEFPYKDAFDITLVPDEDGHAATLKVVLSGMPEDLNGSFGGVLRVQVGHPYLDELQVRFSGVCRPGLPAPVTPPR